ncbi:heat shock 70 kDa protein 12B-like [Crassostrea angulata]|uniref:heat shock 70 kDa protein 12B-like n=1 Tax=Magallana angulata TaxID=2784310 RepID=UPI0022B12D24|nr:heat shock 70 kDa protein 12B-like [Crassostrea angulata]
MSSFLVAAIDFGTTFSGYAFSFLHDYKKEPLKISAKTWTAGVGSLVSLKTSTCVLFDSTQTFHSFGYEAEEKYSNLAIDDEHHDWYFFRRFKMILYNKMKLTRETLLEDDKGKKMEAMKVFSSAIGFLKHHMLTTCKRQLADIEQSDIMWVLTVPAIWTDSSKQFMREAAEKVGISADKLMIALEPEAASLYCMYQPVQKDTENSTFGVFKSGAKYMVVDAGGGTIDITVHEVQDNGTLKELHKANGGDWGGTKVDASFTSLLADIVGNDVMKAFSSIHKYDFLEFLREFEVKKRTITPELTDKVTFKIPIKLLETFCNTNPGSDIKTAITSKPKFENKLTWTGDKLRMDAELTKALFDESSKKIVDHLKQLFRHSTVKDVSTILLVGGFAESPMLQVAIREAFKDKKVIVPQDAGLAVLKGAVLYGHEPKTISARVCKYTYGVNKTNKFKSGIHLKSKKCIINGVERCRDLFSTHVRVGQLVKVGKPQVKQNYHVVAPDQNRISFSIYTSNNKEPTYTTDEGCALLGKLTLHMPDTTKGMNRGANVHMTFSGTEILVTAVDQDNPEKAVTTTVDFLG